MTDYHDQQPTVFVLDFGAQYAQLIARRVREARVYSEIVPFDISAEEVARRAPAAIILSGGPASVYAEGAPHMDPAVLELGIPVLGFCYGIQEMALHLGGQIPKTDIGEYGFAELHVTAPASVLLEGVPETSQCWMSHRDSVGTAPGGFSV
ncbi:MAG: glutamine amidotransferase-related protein, partial [Coriobacteriia bacterium]